MGAASLSVRAALALVLGGCGADAIDVLASRQALRPDDPDAGAQPETFPADAQVEHADGDDGFVRVHFVAEGEHAATADYAAEVAAEYEAALGFYTAELGLAAPLADDAIEGDDGGDARLDVYLIDFATRADGAFRVEGCLPDEPRRCAGYMLHENDFDGRAYASPAQAHRTVASHELFHAIQNAYVASAGVVLGEGSAVWASEVYAPDLTDFERLIGGYLERPERSLAQEPIGPVDTFSYGSALFFRFLEERYDRDVVRLLWEELLAEGEAVDTASWTAALDRVLEAEHGSSLAEAFAEHVRWNLYTGRRADAARAYADGERYPLVTEREVVLPFSDDRVRVFPLSSRRFIADVEEAGEIALEVTENEASLEGLRLLLALESGGEVTALEEVDVASAPRVSLHAARGDRVHVALINTAREGDSLQPALCFAELREHTTCHGEPPAVDGGADASSPDAAPDDATPTAGDGGGCSVSRPARTAPAGLLALLAFCVVMRRRVVAARVSETSRPTEAGSPNRRGRRAIYRAWR